MRNELDPLYVIFERHLYHFSDDDGDRKTFVNRIIQDYLTYLRKMNISVPRSLEQAIVEELSAQVNTMLVKKIYGCLSIDDYRKGASFLSKKKAQSRYKRVHSARPKKTA